MAKIVEKSVTLSRALKEKNRWAGKLALLREQMSVHNSHEVGVPQDIDVLQSLEEAKSVEERLVKVKTALAKANAEIVGSIVALEETKSAIAWLKGLGTKEGKFNSRNFGGTVTETYEATIKGGERLKMMENLQKKANRLQDELDDFNSSHRVTIEVEED